MFWLTEGRSASKDYTPSPNCLNAVNEQKANQPHTRLGFAAAGKIYARGSGYQACHIWNYICRWDARAASRKRVVLGLRAPIASDRVVSRDC